MKKAIFIILLCAFFTLSHSFTTAQVIPTLVFTEIMYDLEGSDSDQEWIEIYNYGAEPVEIITGSGASSFRFFDGSPHTLNVAHGTSTIPATGFAILVDDAAVWLAGHPSFDGNVIDTVMSLKNTSSTIGVSVTRDEQLFTKVTYDASWGAAGNGFTLERKDINSLSNDRLNWIESSIIGGTPGFWSAPDNSETPTSTDDINEEPDLPDDSDDTSTSTDDGIPESEPEHEPEREEPQETSPGSQSDADWSFAIQINELMPNPAGSDSAEWIELYNLSPVSLDIAGWKLQDNTSRVYTISDEDFISTVIPSLGYFLLPRDATGVALNNTGGDKVVLYDSDGNVQEEVVYESIAREDQSWARFDITWRWTSEATPDTQNIATVNQPPVAAFSIEDKPVYLADDSIRFDGSLSSDDEDEDLIYHWDFGDDVTDDEKITTHRYAGPGEYSISLTVTDEQGQSTAATRSLSISIDVEDITLGEITPITFSQDELLLTEFTPNPDGSDAAEWIELKNNSSEEIIISGWQIDDEDGGSKPHTLPVNTTIMAGDYLIIAKEQSRLSLNNSHDEVRLITPLGQIWQVVPYDKAQSGMSYAFNEGDQEWFWSETPSPGTAAQYSEYETPVILGYETSLIEVFDVFSESMEELTVHVVGVVLVPPQSIGKQKMYIAEADGESYAPERLLELYQYRGNFPELTSGDRIEVQGEVVWRDDKPRIKIAGPEAIVKIGHAALIHPDSVNLVDITEDDDSSWITVEASVARINKKSFSISDDDISATVYPVGKISLADINLEKGVDVEVTGFLQFRSDKPRISVLHASDVKTLGIEDDSESEESVEETIEPVGNSKSQNSFGKQLYYLATLPATVGIGWLIKKFFLTKIQ